MTFTPRCTGHATPEDGYGSPDGNYSTPDDHFMTPEDGHHNPDEDTSRLMISMTLRMTYITAQ